MNDIKDSKVFLYMICSLVGFIALVIGVILIVFSGEKMNIIRGIGFLFISYLFIKTT
jgi:hypothetical protein